MEGNTIMEFNITLVTWINSKEYNLTIIDFEFEYQSGCDYNYLVCDLAIFPIGENWKSLFRIGYNNVFRTKRKFRLHLLWIRLI